MVSKTWKENCETFCIGLNWERFSDLDHALVINIVFLKLILQELNTSHCSTISLPYIFLFSRSSVFQGLVSCMGGKVLSGIFERMVKNMRHVRSGIPDLVVWNTETKKFKVKKYLLYCTHLSKS